VSDVRKPKIVVLGGGLGALSAAYWLTEAMPDWQDKYDSFTVHQMGWRLGGKCASGRNPEMGERIEEHGLHVWFGFYENAFRTMERLLASVPRDPEIRTYRTMDEAFSPQHGWTLEQYLPSLNPHWTVQFPRNSGKPGRGEEDFVRAVRENLLGWILNGQRILIHRDDIAKRSGPVGSLVRMAHRALRLTGGLARLVGAFSGRVGDDLADWLVSAPPHPSRLRMLPHLLRTTVDGIWESMASEADDEEAERVRFVVDLVGTSLLGVIQDRLWEPLWFPRSKALKWTLKRALYGRHEPPFPPHFESADGEELREWLLRHGAHEETVKNGGFLDQFYDVAFAYDRGDRGRPEVAAGTGLRGILRFLLGYKGAYLWRMNSGMGDTVFVPFYAALRARGVRFEFFHRVEQLELSPDRKRIGRIRIQRQARLRNGDYCPLVRVGHLDCWPSVPKWEELEPDDARAIQEHLLASDNPLDLESSDGTWPGVEGERADVDVSPDDVVILGIPIGCFPKTCAQLLEADSRWGDMVERITAIPTYAVQLWLNKSTEHLGWKNPIHGSLPILCGYDRDLHSWADMSHLLEHEWLTKTEKERPKSIHYFCGVFDDGVIRGADGRPAGYGDQLKAFRARAQHVFEKRIGRLWPEYPLGLDPSVLEGPGVAKGTDPYDAQYWRVNVDPTERYTLSPRGSTRFRLPSGHNGFENLWLAGDWTRNGVLNMGCVEGSIVSGMECAEAIASAEDRAAKKRGKVVTRKSIDVIAGRSIPPSPDAPPPGVLDRARLVGDCEADAIAARILQQPHDRANVMKELAKLAGARTPGVLPGTAQCPVPSVPLPRPSEETVAIVRQLFETNASSIFLILACYSLPSAYAAANGARVLGRTRYLLETPIRRLCETAQFVIDVMTNPYERGLESARRVRLIHAAIRRLISSDEREQWDALAWGVPLNQEDQAGTLMSFSWVVLDGLRKLGAESVADARTRDATIEVWSWIGSHLGIQPILLPKSFEEAEALTRAIWAHQIVPRVPNPVGRELTQKLLEKMEETLPLPGFDPFVSCMMRFLLPPDVADSIGVPLRRVRDFTLRTVLEKRVFSRVFRSLLNDWGWALVDQVMRDSDQDGMLVHFDEIEDRWRGPVGPMRRMARGAVTAPKAVKKNSSESRARGGRKPCL
jgi:hypothetical protein